MSGATWYVLPIAHFACFGALFLKAHLLACSCIIVVGFKNKKKAGGGEWGFTLREQMMTSSQLFRTEVTLYLGYITDGDTNVESSLIWVSTDHDDVGNLIRMMGVTS